MVLEAAALAAFEAARRPIVDKITAAARKSYIWYEAFSENMQTDAYSLAYDYMTRSGRMDDDRLRGIAPKFMAEYDAATGGRRSESGGRRPK